MTTQPLYDIIITEREREKRKEKEMMHLVIFIEEYVGYHFDEHTKFFKDEQSAKEYCQRLNAEFAEENHCAVEDLGDYYTVEWVKEG